MDKSEMAQRIVSVLDDRFDYKINTEDIELDGSFTIKTLKGELFTVTVNKLK